MTIDLSTQPADVGRATTSVRGPSPRDLERELAEWTCANQEAIGDTPVEIDEALLTAVAPRG